MKPELSIVIPLFNEESLIDVLVTRVLTVMDRLDIRSEVIFVDDGSKDLTYDLLLKHQQKDNRIKIISLSRNFGHQPAYTAGLRYSKGDYIVMLDGDLQDPPELIVEMLDKARDECIDVLIGQRETVAQTRARKYLAQKFHWLFEKILNIDTPG